MGLSQTFEIRVILDDKAGCVFNLSFSSLSLPHKGQGKLGVKRQWSVI